MNQLCDRIRECKCQVHNKEYSFILCGENRQDTQRGMCHRCVNPEMISGLFNIENVFEFLKNEQNDEDALVNTYKASIWQQFKLTKMHIIELLEQLETQLEAFLEDIRGNTIISKIKEQYIDKEFKLTDIEAFGQLLGNYIKQDSEGIYHHKEQLKIEEQSGYIKSIEIIQVQDQARTILSQKQKQKELANTIQPQQYQQSYQDEIIQIADTLDYRYQTNQTINLGDKGYSLCFNHNETQIAIAVGKIIIFNLTDEGLWILDSNSLNGYDEKICQVRFSHDSSQIVSSDFNGLIVIWSKQNDGKWIINEELNEHTNQVNTICFNHDSTLLASGSYKIYIWTYSMQKWKLKQTLNEHTGYVLGLCFNNDSTLLASASNVESVIIWELDYDQEWAIRQTLKSHTDGVLGVQFNAESTQLLTCSKDETIKIWSINKNLKWECNHTLIGHTDNVRRVVFSKQSDVIVSSSNDDTIKIWRTNSENEWECQQTIQSHCDSVNCVIINSNSSMIISVGYDNLFMVHNLQPEPFKQNSASLIFVNKNQTLIAITQFDKFKLFRLNEKGQWVGTKIEFDMHCDDIRHVEFDESSTQIISCGYDYKIIVWSNVGGHYWSMQCIESHSDAVSKATFNKNATLMASASQDRNIIIYSKINGKWQLQQVLIKHSKGVLDVSFSQDLPLLASAGQDGIILIWKQQSSGEWIFQQKLIGHTNFVGSVEFNQGSTQLISSSADKTIRVWGTQNNIWKCIHTIHDDTNIVRQAQFCLSQARIISRYSDNSFKIWELQGDEWKCIETIAQKKNTFQRYNFGILLSVEYIYDKDDNKDEDEDEDDNDKADEDDKEDEQDEQDEQAQLLNNVQIMRIKINK